MQKRDGAKDAYFGEEPTDSFKVASMGVQNYKNNIRKYEKEFY